MAEEQVGVSPVSSIDTLSYMLRMLRKRGVFGETLDPALEDLARALGPAMPGNLFPDTYLVQPLVGNDQPAAGFVLDAYERNYLRYLTEDAYFEAAGIQACAEPAERMRLCGLLSTSSGLRAFACEDRSFESHLLTDKTRRANVCESIGIPSGSPEERMITALAALPLRVFVRATQSHQQLVIALPFSDFREHFGVAPFKDELLGVLANVGIEAHRLAALEKVCTRQGIPCYSESLGFIHWRACVDVSHVTLTFSAGHVASASAGIRISERSIPYLRKVFRPLRVYQWHITDNCDQRCKHCYLFAEDARARCISTPFDQLLSTLDEIEASCAQMHCVPALAVSGGDPILHPRFWDFAEELHRRGFTWTLMGNPFHLNDEACQRLHLLGCARYQLSLDGLRTFHDSLRKPGSFDATLAAIPLLKAAGIPVQLMATASNKNLSDILACMDLAVELDVDSFVFARYCATSPDKATELYPTPDEYRAFLLAYYEKRRAFIEAGTRCEFKLKEHLFTLLKYELGEFEVPSWSIEHPDVVCDGCHLGVSGIIASNGDLLACRRMDSVVGNISEGHLADIEASEAMRAYREVGAIKGCSDCKLLMWCRGCRAVGYNATGDLQAADPMCWHQVQP